MYLQNAFLVQGNKSVVNVLSEDMRTPIGIYKSMFIIQQWRNVGDYTMEPADPLMNRCFTDTALTHSNSTTFSGH